MLRTRVLTAALLLPLVLAAFSFGPSWFIAAFLLACVTLSLLETVGMLLPAFEQKLAGVEIERPEGPFWKHLTLKGHGLHLVTVAIGWLMFLSSAFASEVAARGGVVLGVLLALACGIFSTRTLERSEARAFALTVSVVYGALPWLAVWDLYLMGPNARYIFLVMAITWAGDTGGYFGGRFFGGKLFGDRKLAPRISPKKTWEGAISGLVMSVVAAMLLNLAFLGELASYPLLAIVALLAGAAGQVGDLVESVLKRFSGVKDSGTIFPGHGGFLDRVDAILFSAPVIWFSLHYFG